MVEIKQKSHLVACVQKSEQKSHIAPFTRYIRPLDVECSACLRNRLRRLDYFLLTAYMLAKRVPTRICPPPSSARQ